MDGISSLSFFVCGVDSDGHGGGWDDMDEDSDGDGSGGTHEGGDTQRTTDRPTPTSITFSFVCGCPDDR